MSSRMVILTAICCIALVLAGFLVYVEKVRNPLVMGYTIDQWVERLRLNKPSSHANSPLAIYSVSNGGSRSLCSVDVQLDYDELKKYDFFVQNGRLHLIVNGQLQSDTPGRADDGSCMLWFSPKLLILGTNTLQATFWLFQRRLDNPTLSVVGPITYFVNTNSVNR